MNNYENSIGYSAVGDCDQERNLSPVDDERLLERIAGRAQGLSNMATDLTHILTSDAERVFGPRPEPNEANTKGVVGDPPNSIGLINVTLDRLESQLRAAISQASRFSDL